MLIEYCDGGALDSIMVELEKALTEPQIAYVCSGICRALSFLHSHKVIHRDLKAGNVLLTIDGGVKLGMLKNFISLIFDFKYHFFCFILFFRIFYFLLQRILEFLRKTNLHYRNTARL